MSIRLFARGELRRFERFTESRKMSKVVFFLALMLSFPAYSHDEFHDWLTPDGQMKCCNGSDCKVVKLETSPDGTLFALYPTPNGIISIPVPKHLYVNHLHSTGRPVACYDYVRNVWYCFSPGAAL